jgi:hypothetical protein
MGWSFTYNATKKDIIENRIKTEENEHAKWITHAHCLKGNVLWFVREIFYKQGEKAGTSEKYIACSILGKDKGYGWGSKDLEESCGPAYYTCPLKYLDMVTLDPTSTYAPAWREKVREYHRQMDRAKNVEIGDTLILQYAKIPSVEVISVRPLLGRNGLTYRIPRRLVKEVVRKI